jgi:uncharacterized membrane protein YbaN (DUF454 family)
MDAPSSPAHLIGVAGVHLPILPGTPFLFAGSILMRRQYRTPA